MVLVFVDPENKSYQRSFHRLRGNLADNRGSSVIGWNVRRMRRDVVRERKNDFLD